MLRGTFVVVVDCVGLVSALPVLARSGELVVLRSIGELVESVDPES